MKKLAIESDIVDTSVMCLVWKILDFRIYFHIVTHMEPVKEVDQERLGLTTFVKTVKL